MVAFIGSGLMARLFGSLIKVDYNGTPTSLQAVRTRCFTSPLRPKFASLLWGCPSSCSGWAFSGFSIVRTGFSASE